MWLIHEDSLDGENLKKRPGDIDCDEGQPQENVAEWTIVQKLEESIWCGQRIRFARTGL